MVVSVLVVAVAAHTLLPLSWTISLLMGAIVTSTDAAAVFAVLRNVPLPKRLSGMLEAESGFNDAPVVILVVAFAAQGVPGGTADPWWVLVLHAAVELAGGAIVGGAVGWLGGQVLRRVAGASSALFSIGVVALTVLAYAVGAALHVSGFLATYLVGARARQHGAAQPGRRSRASPTRSAGSPRSGCSCCSACSPTRRRLGEQLVPAIVIGLVLLLVARPLSVVASVSWFKVPWRDQVFLSWAGLRGAVPVVLATVPLVVGTPDTEWIFDLVFMLVVVFTIVQAPSLPWVARRLGLTEQVHSVDVDLESTSLMEIGADVIQVTVGAESRLHGVAVFELRLPKGANVTLVVRGGEGFVPDAAHHDPPR